MAIVPIDPDDDEHIDAALTPIEKAIEDSFRRNFSRFFAPDFLLALRRFLSKANLCRTYSVSVGTAPVQLVAYNPTRVRVGIFNNGNTTIFYGRPRAVVSGAAGTPDSGFPILPNTGILITDSVAEIWAVSTAAAMDVRVEDVTLESI